MNRLQNAAVLVDLVDRLRARGSWCGETHVQKTVYFLEELMKVPLGFDFILYKHGPFSFDLRDEMTSLRADEILQLEFQAPPYGPKFSSTAVGQNLRDRHPKTIGEYGNRIAFVANTLGGKTVAELERLGTALYVTREKMGEEDPIESRAQRIHQYKPHVSFDEACQALADLEQISLAAAAVG